MESLIQDLKFGIRMLRKSPGFTIVAVLTLALGIGANTAVFTVVDAVLLRRLPVRDPERLMLLWETNPSLGSFIGDQVPTAFVNFREWRKQATKSFSGIAGMEDADLNVTGTGDPERIDGARATPNIFSVLGVRPVLGQSFHPEEGETADRQVILGYSYWQRHFSGNVSVIGSTIRLNDQSYVITGVLPASFHLPAMRAGAEQHKPDVWIPYAPEDLAQAQEFNRRKMYVFGRLAQQATLASARAELNVIGKRLAQQNPDLDAGFGINAIPVEVEDIGKELRKNLLLLMMAVSGVLLIACLNLGMLISARARSRAAELGIRRALGASSPRLVQQMTSETLLLAVFGGLGSVLVAELALRGMLALNPSEIQRPEDIHLNATVLLFTAGACAAVTLFFSIVSALQIPAVQINPLLKQSAGGQSTRRTAIPGVAVSLQVGITFLLLFTATLMMRSLINVWAVDPGFRPQHALIMNVSLLPEKFPTKESMAQFCQNASDEIRRLPGVESASFADGLPMTRIRMMRFTVEGQPTPASGSEPTADLRGIASPDYFSSIGIPIIEGRNFTKEEIDRGDHVIMVNRALADRLWPGQDAIGKEIRNGTVRNLNKSPLLTVIGVVGNTHQLSLEKATRPEVTRPMVDYTRLTLIVRSKGDPAALTSAIKNAIWKVNKDVPVFNVHTLQEVLEDSQGQRRFDSFLTSFFAALALLLVVVGIYGVLSYSVEQQRKEIGIRLAVGASEASVLRMVLGRGLRIAAGGLLLGILAAAAAGRVLGSLLYGVSPDSPGTFGVITLLLLLISIIACYVPAKVAARTDPNQVLRAE